MLDLATDPPEAFCKVNYTSEIIFNEYYLSLILLLYPCICNAQNERTIHLNISNNKDTNSTFFPQYLVEMIMYYGKSNFRI